MSAGTFFYSSNGLLSCGGRWTMKAAGMIFALSLVSFRCYATALMPPIEEAQARAWADVVAEAKVISIIHRGDQEQANIILIQILTEGVSAKTNVTVLWNQTLANATRAHKDAPKVGLKYQVYLRLLWGGHEADFEPVHADWGFVELKDTSAERGPAFITHTVHEGDTLWRLSAHYYGTGARWRVLRAANFTNDAPLGVYRLTNGMRFQIPTFPTQRDSPSGVHPFH